MARKEKVPGYRFHPTAVELIEYFLKRKVQGKKFPEDTIAELDLYKYAPWDLPDMSTLKSGDLEWFFFCARGKKYLTGGRMNRATEVGYWKTTGKDRAVEHDKRVVGMIKTLVFHTGKAPKGDRTDWVMHEYRLVDKELADKGVPQDSYVICKVFQKEGLGPRNGAQYGKPFDEKEWASDEENDSVQTAPVAAGSAPVHIQPSESHSSVANVIHPSTSGCVGLTSVSCVSKLMPSCSAHPSTPNNHVHSVSCVSELTPSCLAHPLAPNNQVDSLSCVSELMPSSSVHPSSPNNQAVNDILPLFDYFKDADDTLVVNQNNELEKVDDPNQANNAELQPCSDPNKIFEDLVDLDSLLGLGEGHFCCGQNNEYTTSQMLYTGDIIGSSDPQDFLELIDLEAPQLWQNKHGSCSHDK